MTDEERERYRQLSLAALARARELSYSIAIEKARGNIEGVAAMVPIFERKLREYVYYGELSDPDRLTDWDHAILGLAGTLSSIKQWIAETGGKLADTASFFASPVGLILAVGVAAWAFGGFRRGR